MSFYETYILPKFLDCVCSQQGFQNKRAQIFPHASGEVLEIGVGTGLNFEFYDFDKVSSVKGIDPSISSLEIANKRIIEMNIPIEVMEGSAEENENLKISTSEALYTIEAAGEKLNSKFSFLSNLKVVFIFRFSLKKFKSIPE